MAAANYTLTIEQGATLALTLAISGTDAPVDLVGYTARMQVRSSVQSSATLAEWSTTSGHLVIDGAARTITLTVPATETAALTKGGVYDFELVAPDGFVTRLIEGTAPLSKEVTR